MEASNNSLAFNSPHRKHVWAKRLKNIVGEHGAFVVDQQIIGEDVLAKLGARLRETKEQR